MDTMNTKEKAMGVAAISPIILVAAAMAREFWAVFIIVGLLTIAYLVLEQEEDSKIEEEIILKQEQ